MTESYAVNDAKRRTVLVAVVNNADDLQRAASDGWYRIPQRKAPRRVGADYIAFYQTGAFKGEPEAQSITYFAPTRRYRLMTRAELLPDEADHPRADNVYYKMQLGPLMRLERPIPSLRWRRITFIETSWDRFTAAEEVNDLYVSGADGLFVTLKDAGFYPEREYSLRERGVKYVVDMAIPCHSGTVAITTDDRAAPPYVLRNPDVEGVRQAVELMDGPLPIHKTGR